MLPSGIFHTGLFLLFQIKFSVFGQHCPNGPAKLIQATHLSEHDLGTCVSVSDYSYYLTSFLDTCTFTRNAEATCRGACQYECIYGNGCNAMTYNTTHGCHICRTVAQESGNGNSYPRDDVFVAGWMLRAYIDGQCAGSVMPLLKFTLIHVLVVSGLDLQGLYQGHSKKKCSCVHAALDCDRQLLMWFLFAVL